MRTRKRRKCPIYLDYQRCRHHHHDHQRFDCNEAYNCKFKNYMAEKQQTRPINEYRDTITLQDYCTKIQKTEDETSEMLTIVTRLRHHIRDKPVSKEQQRISSSTFQKILRFCEKSSTVLFVILILILFCNHIFLKVYCTKVARLKNSNLFSPTTQFQATNLKTHLPDIITQQGGIIKDRNVSFIKQHSPILITKDIVIKKDAKLTIESGVEVLFEKKTGIIVHGTLEILGEPNDRVRLNLLKSQQSATINLRSQNNNNLARQQVRLVDGDLPNEGRVQIKFNDRWHSLCTNSKNLTAADIKVLCQQVGYQDGSWYKWFPKRNETGTYPLQIMSKSFHCSGTETAIMQCRRWNRVRAGGGICDSYSDLGIRCSKKLVFNDNSEMPTYEFWRGVEFVHGETSYEYVLDGQMKQKVSKSILKYVTISEAGSNHVGNATGAIRVLGHPPRMSNIEIKNSVYGIFVEDADDAISMDNIRLLDNMASPLFINTSWGKISLNDMHIENNGGDGIRIARHEKVLVGNHDFCRFANLGSSQSFPVVLSHEQTFFTTGYDCCQEFFSNNQLTVHFPVLRSTPNNLLPDSDNNRRVAIPTGINIGKDANLVIYDDYRDEFPFKLRVRNSTRAQSIVSKSGRLKICYEPAIYRTVLFTIQVVSDEDDEWSGRARDVEIKDSFIKGNEGRGVWVENQRSGIKLINTTVMNNNYIGGVHTENGTGEVIIQASTIINNTGHGILINLAGGYYHIDNSTISDNSLKGIAIEYDKRPELLPFNHTFHLGYSLVARNGENGLFIGNVCRSDAFWNVSMNSFVKNGEDAILYQSCLPTQELVGTFKNQTSRLNLTDPDMAFSYGFQDLYLTHNMFLSNLRRAINLSPVYFVKSFIRHNLFRDHPLAVLYISNQISYDAKPDAYMLAPVNIRIASNRFYSNRGRYVANIGVLEDSPRQAIMFTKNFIEDNHINEPYADLKPRSRVSAVVLVSSSNTKVVRNRFNNPISAFEMGTLLEQHSKIINATTNFWGRGLDAASIYRRIFDRKNRYNLAQIEFLQYLLSPEDLEYASDLSFDRERDKISTFRNGTILGGEVKGYEELETNTYIVKDDIYVRPGSHLILKAGTVLKFDDGVGMMVQGRLDALGQSSTQILLTSALQSNRMPQRTQFIPATTSSSIANSWVSHHSEMIHEEEDSTATSSFKNRTNWYDRGSRIKKRQASIGQNVRLSHTTMGRLEVQIDGIWGSVCDYGFDIDDAAVACQQLGMILNNEDWLLQRFQFAANDQQQVSMISSNVLMTNLRCDPTLDMDITKCKSEISLRGDFDGLCNSEVGLRCFPPSWSGVRLGMAAEVSTLEHVSIQKAGMFDYASYTLKPALQIDFNRHWITSLVIKSNSDSGLGILFNDVIGRHYSELVINEGKFLSNERHGIELRSRGLIVKNVLISNNCQHGIDYNPSFSQRELQDLLSWLYTPKNKERIVTLTFPLRINDHFSIPSSEDAYKFFVIQRNPQIDLIETFTIATDPGHMLSIQILNPIHPESSESLNMSIGMNPESPIWDLKINMTSFPMVSPGYKFHFNYTSGKNPRGNIVLYIRSRYSNRDMKILNRFIPNHLVMPKFDLTANNINSRLINSIVVANSTISKNGIGLKFRHPNYPFEFGARYNLRYANETTNITNNIFEGNLFSALYIGSDDYGNSIEFMNRTIASSEIRYHLIGNKIRKNKDGIRQFSRDTRFSSNVFHWSINDTIFEQNKGGGINIKLSYFLPYDANLSHTMEMHNNSFFRNTQFEFTLDGHFVEFNMTKNNFQENRCKNTLIYFGGMEKKMLIRNNMIEYNTCSRILEFDVQSHADKLGSVAADLSYNTLRFNRRIPTNATNPSYISSFSQPKLSAKLHPLASDFAVSLRGVQALNITRNLFVNPELRFELVVGITMDPSEGTVNAAENYWGSLLPSEINERILDFDDWNNHAIAIISPYLTQDSFTAASMIAEPRDQIQTVSKALGGRLTKSMVLPSRKEPYLVESDLTIMPNVRLIIEKGVTLSFMPNVGILVLGDLVAAGTRDKPITMRPVLTVQDIMPLHNYLLPVKSKPTIIQTNLNNPLSYEQNYAFRNYQFAYPIDMGSIRLCKNEICNDGSHIYENNVEDRTLRQEVLKSNNNTWKMDGFLEIFNMTTLQWVPVCDPLFTEHSANVVCRQLGYSHLSLIKRGRRYTTEQEQLSSVKSWPESVNCVGDEASLSGCPLIPLGYVNHTTVCAKEGNQFVYIHCSDFPEANSSLVSKQTHSYTDEHVHHWGGIRFSCPSTPSGTLHDSKDTFNTISQTPYLTKSKLQYVSIDKAGMLHKMKSPAIQVLQCNVQMEYVAISNSAHHGLEMITSQGNQNLHQLRIKNNLGVGLNYLSLTGSSSASKLVPYLPLKHLDISNDIFGLIDICGAKKEIQIEERLLLFYRYSSQPVDCIKIISSKLNIKHVGVRMLRFDLFNSTAYSTRPDFVRFYDGNIFDRDSRLLVELGVTEKHRIERPELKFYQTSDNTLTIRIHASGASRLHGFIAEVITTPVSYNIQRDTYNNVTYSEIINNKLGAVAISSAGESSPNLILKNNRFESNCLHLFGNFTSCASAIYMELQNCQKLKVVNNLIKSNQGGLTIKTYSHSAVSSLEASIENNVFESNSNTNTIALIGPKTDPYQSTRILRNYITRNDARYRSNILLAQVVANFSHNIVSGNIGKHQIEVIGFDKLPLSYQIFENNWIYNNSATLERDRSTIFSNSAGQKFLENYVVNADNHFEISTMNWSRYDVKPFYTPRDDEVIHLISGDGSSKDFIRKTVDAIPVSIIDTKRIDLYHATIDAKNNWWGFSSGAAIQGRIRDRIQHEELLKVDFVPFLETNRTLLNGICAGGWKRVGDSCLVYIGSKMTFNEAREFCDRERATLPLLRGDHYEFTDFVKTQDYEFDSRIDRVWIRSFDVSRDACPALNDYTTKNYDCLDKYSFLCEKDPLVVVSFWHWYRETDGLIALILALITMILTLCCTVCWGLKSREKSKERLMRKNSIRSNTLRAYSSNNSLRDFVFNSPVYQPEKSSVTDMSLSTQLSNEIMNTILPDQSSFSPTKQTFKSNRKETSRHDIVDTMPSYANIKPQKPQYTPQPSMNPSYADLNHALPSSESHRPVSASSQSSLKEMRQSSRLSTPAPSYREAHPRALNSADSRTPSYAGSQTDDLLMDPIPQITKFSTYSQIRHTSPPRHFSSFNVPPPFYNSNGQSIEPLKTKEESVQYKRPLERSNHPDQSQEIDDSTSPSTIPTFYSTEVETFEESSHSYIEAYNGAYNRTLHKMSNDQSSYTMTEQSSTTDDLLMNYTSQLSPPFEEFYNQVFQPNLYESEQTITSTMPPATVAGAPSTSSTTNLISMQPQATSDYIVNSAGFDKRTNLQHDRDQQSQLYKKATSERGSLGGISQKQYCVETSLDEIGTPAPPSIISTSQPFGGSQQLSPISASSRATSDSKLGSRVYLQTSF